MAGQRFMRLFVVVALACLLRPAGAVAANAPLTSWSVGPIRAQSSSGLSYCSMKNKYQSGHGLVFARDAGGSNSIAVDFGKKMLAVGGQYTVNLIVAPLTRQMVAIAATPDVLIVQMGLDAPFYEMLRRKDALQVTVRDQVLTFGLNGTAAALDKLDDCALALGQGKTFLPARVAATDAPPPLPGVAAAEEEPQVPLEVSPEEKVPSLGEQARDSVLEREVARLKEENRKLLLENQDVVRRMMEADAREATAEPPPEPAVVAVAVPEKKPAVEKKKDRFDWLASYKWRYGDVIGHAQELSVVERDFDQAIGTYIRSKAVRCHGDFAQRRETPENLNKATVIYAETACLGDAEETASALLFVSSRDRAFVVTHEGPAERAQVALDKRDAFFEDKIVRNLN